LKFAAANAAFRGWMASDIRIERLFGAHPAGPIIWLTALVFSNVNLSYGLFASYAR